MAWSSDVLHVMHLGADETLAQHDATTGNEEPDSTRGDGLSDDLAVEPERFLLPVPSRARQPVFARPDDAAGDDHSRILTRPPRV